jgi:arylsulfatase A-like enzyme
MVISLIKFPTIRYYRCEKRSCKSKREDEDDQNLPFLTCSFPSRCFQDPEKVQEWTALYYALIEEIDFEIGALMETLGDEASNTLVIFTSDHGEMLGAHGKREKNDFYEGKDMM